VNVVESQAGDSRDLKVTGSFADLPGKYWTTPLCNICFCPFHAVDSSHSTLRRPWQGFRARQTFKLSHAGHRNRDCRGPGGTASGALAGGGLARPPGARHGVRVTGSLSPAQLTACLSLSLPGWDSDDARPGPKERDRDACKTLPTPSTPPRGPAGRPGGRARARAHWQAWLSGAPTPGEY
jgi:hypothetical protein